MKQKPRRKPKPLTQCVLSNELAEKLYAAMGRWPSRDAYKSTR